MIMITIQKVYICIVYCFDLYVIILHNVYDIKSVVIFKMFMCLSIRAEGKQRFFFSKFSSLLKENERKREIKRKRERERKIEKVKERGREREKEIRKE